MNTCAVDNCNEPIKRLEYCYGHYMKQWRYGTPTPTHATRRANIAGKRYGTLTATHPVGQKWHCACDCGNYRLASIGELNRTGDANTCGTKSNHLTDEVGYTGAHDRVKRTRGFADQHECVGCGRAASHWSYDHNDPEERYALGLSAKAIAYSLKTECYSPRCVPCHKRYDLDRINSTYQGAA